MKLKSKRLVGALTVLAVTLLLLVGIGVYFLTTANATPEPVYKIETFQSKYQYGDSLTLADGYVEIGGESYKLDSTVVYPDGRTTNYKELVLDCVGDYTVNYSAELAGVKYSTASTFAVSRTMANQFVNVQDCEITANVDSPSNTGKFKGGEFESIRYNGVSVKATSTDAQIRYNGIVNLSKLNRNKPFLKFLFTPEQMGTIEASKIVIRLTDIYDQNNFVDMQLDPGSLYGPYEDTSYIRFSVNNLYDKLGMLETETEAFRCIHCNQRTAFSEASFKKENTDDGTGNPKHTTVDGKQVELFKYTYKCPSCEQVNEYESNVSYYIQNGTYYGRFSLYYYDYDANGDYSGKFKKAEFGHSIATSFYGQFDANGDDYLALPLYFDTENKSVWSELVHTFRGTDRQWKVFDFEDKDIVGTNIWDGFTSNEVYMDVFIGGTAKGATILITEANGISLSGDSYVTGGAPSISIDYGDYTAVTMPHGVAGAGYSYPVPNVYAYSTNCGIINDVDVFVGYVTSTGITQVPVVDGKFATANVGEYVIRYSATDENGSATQAFLPIQVDESYANEINYDFNPAILSSYSFGIERIELYEGVATGGTGNLSLSTSLTLNGENVDINIDGDLRYFAPTVAGEYELKFTLTDFIGTQKSFTKTINVVDDGTPIFAQFYLPDAIRANYEFELPIISAKCGTSDATVVVKINDQVVTDGVYTPTQAGDITVSYTATNPADSTKTATDSKVIKVLAKNEESGKFTSSYLLADGMSYKNSSLESIAYDVTNTDEASLYFANSVVSTSAGVTFSFTAGKANVDKVVITFIDAVTGQEYAVEIRKVDASGSAVAYHNGLRLAQLSGNFGTQAASVMGISYIGDGFIKDTVDNSIIGSLTNATNGRAFKEFGTKVYVKIEIFGAENGTVFELRSISNQAFNNSIDRAAPVVYFAESFPSNIVVDYEGTVTVPKAQAFDVLGSVNKISVTVLAPDKTTVYNGSISEDYTFTAKQYGYYRVTYYVEDDSGNGEEPVVLNFVVPDTIAPVIGEVGLNDIEYSVGDTITIPTFEASDNCDALEDLNIYVLVCDNEDMYRIVTDSYTFTKAGTYRIRFVAADKSMNMSYKELVVRVMED